MAFFDDGPKKKKLSPLIGVRRKSSERLLVHGTSLASVESLSLPLVQEIVLSADIGCSECQKRIAEIMSRMSETESVVVNVLDKKVTLTCRYPINVAKVPARQVPAVHRNSINKMAMLRRIFKPSST
ncbi:Heavy metal-associated domain containing protein [Parasponia andersonii]|uniref:Heavy metal-associated domain containing protein n=1 Tax=Parasponia andersonii TaxID=3476 RepID=A0A2P5CET6_PARAD|nr:Heavy metal-associated domain containing protein [Parasponia andersonii]